MPYPEMLKYWEEIGHPPVQQVVVCAANRFKSAGVILCGARHWDDVMRAQADAMGIKGGNEEQGFIDQFGTFLTREEAMQIVKESGQPFNEDRNGGAGKALFSEGLY
jgi:hypothetical protein